MQKMSVHDFLIYNLFLINLSTRVETPLQIGVYLWLGKQDSAAAYRTQQSTFAKLLIDFMVDDAYILNTASRDIDKLT